MMLWLLSIPILWFSWVKYSNYKFRVTDNYRVIYEHKTHDGRLACTTVFYMQLNQGQNPDKKAWSMVGDLNPKGYIVKVRSITKIKVK